MLTRHLQQQLMRVFSMPTIKQSPPLTLLERRIYQFNLFLQQKLTGYWPWLKFFGCSTTSEFWCLFLLKVSINTPLMKLYLLSISFWSYGHHVYVNWSVWMSSNCLVQIALHFLVCVLCSLVSLLDSYMVQ